MANFESPTPPVTIKDLARTLGLSRAAISLALRDSPKIGEATRGRVHAAARELGYQPNPSAAALAHFKWGSVIKPVQAALAWLNTWPEPDKLRRYQEFNRYWLGATAAAQKFGYRLEEFAVEQYRPLSRLERILRARGIGGVILPPHASNIAEPEWGDFHWGHFAAVRLGRRTEGPQFHFVTSAQAANAMLAFDKMRERGYRRIGFVGAKHRNRMFGAGFLWVQHDVPQRLRLPPLLLDYATGSGCQPQLEAWLKRTSPDAILTENADLPRMLGTAGYRIPEDIGLAATSVLDCPIDAGIDQNPEEIGRMAMLLLMSHINDNARGIPPIQHEILVKGTWVDGTSLPLRT